MNKDLIEKLKDPKQAQPFGLLSPEEQKVYLAAETINCLKYHSGAVWTTTYIFSDDSTYILKPDYEPEPEYVDIEIVADGLWWALKETIPGTKCHVNMADAALRRTFVHYMSDDHRSTRVVGLATQWASEGKKVIARFVKE